jgi:hypothetical protein
MKKQSLIFAIIGLFLTLGAGPLLAQSTTSDTATSTTKTTTTKANADADKAAATTAATKTKEATAPAAGPPPQKGMVWVNTASGVYYKEGSKWYGNTKQGKYMTEADAKKAGYKASQSISN